MKNKTNKKEKNTNKYGVFNGNLIKSETVASETEFVIEPYKDDSITITKIETKSKKRVKKDEVPTKVKKKHKNILYKIIASFIITITFVGGIIFLALSL